MEIYHQSHAPRFGRVARSFLVLLLVFAQLTADAAPYRRRARWICPAILATVTMVAGAVGYFGFTATGPVSMELENVPAEVQRDPGLDAISSRIALFNSRRDEDGRVTLALRDANEAAPQLVLFDKNFVQLIVSGHVKAEIKRRNPDYVAPAKSGIVVSLERIEIHESAEDRDQVIVAVGGPYMSLLAKEPISKARLLSGNTITIDFAYTQPIEGGGTAQIDARAAVRFNAAKNRFEVIEGKGAFAVVIPGRVNEHDVATFSALHSGSLRD